MAGHGEPSGFRLELFNVQSILEVPKIVPTIKNIFKSWSSFCFMNFSNIFQSLRSY